MKKLIAKLLARIGYQLIAVQPPARLVIYLQGKEWTTVLVDEAEKLTIQGKPVCIRINQKPFIAIQVVR